MYYQNLLLSACNYSLGIFLSRPIDHSTQYRKMEKHLQEEEEEAELEVEDCM